MQLESRISLIYDLITFVFSLLYFTLIVKYQYHIGTVTSRIYKSHAFVYLRCVKYEYGTYSILKTVLPCYSSAAYWSVTTILEKDSAALVEHMWL